MKASAVCLLMAAMFAADRADFGQDNPVASGACRSWISRVDPSLGTVPVELQSMPSQREIFEAIDCLLQSRGNKRPARFGGATRPDVSQILPPATVEVAALYYISYLYQGRWQHGDGVALWNRKGVINPPGAVEVAYVSYQDWFQRVKKIGIAAARASDLNPLQGTGLSWYGK